MMKKDPSQGRESNNDRTNGTSVLFVCLGNICRSPLAEGVLRHLLGEAEMGEDWRVESAGTAAYHVGESADRRSCAVAAANGITLSGVARKLRSGDFRAFDYILAMDRENLADIEALRESAGGRRAGRAAVHLLRDFDPEADGERDVPDPYYEGDHGFERVYEMVHRSCVAFLERSGA